MEGQAIIRNPHTVVFKACIVVLKARTVMIKARTVKLKARAVMLKARTVIDATSSASSVMWAALSRLLAECSHTGCGPLPSYSPLGVQILIEKITDGHFQITER